MQVRKTRLAEGDRKKELVKGRFAIRHHQMGSVLLGLMVMGAIGGIVVTYINNGKIMIGSHLFAGLGMVGLIAASASLVPFMQKQQYGGEGSRVSGIYPFGYFHHHDLAIASPAACHPAKLGGNPCTLS